MRNKKNWGAGIVLLFAFLAFASCAKHTTPKKVDKHLSDGTWKIAQAKIDGTAVTANYNGVKFMFSKQGTIYVSGEMVTEGSWSLGGEKNPVVLFMSFPVSAVELYGFSDDWLVMEMSRTECTIKRNESAEVEDMIVFRKID